MHLFQTCQVSLTVRETHALASLLHEDLARDISPYTHVNLPIIISITLGALYASVKHESHAFVA